MDIAVPSNNGVRNTGKIEGGFNPGIIIGAILLPYSFEYTVESAHFTNAEIIAACILALKKNLVTAIVKERFRFIGPFESLDDQSEDPTVQTLGYGKKITTSDGLPYHMFTFDEGGLQYFNSVLSYRDKQRQFKVLYFDAKGNVYATRVYGTITDDLNGPQVLGFKGFKLNRLYPNNWKLANKDTEALYGIEFGIADDKEFNENLFVIETGLDLAGLAEEYAVQDVLLTLSTAAIDGIIDISAWTGLHKLNIAEELPDIVDPTNFICMNEVLGLEITIDSVEWVPDTKCIKFRLDTVDADYVEGDKASIALIGVTDLATAGFKYYESNKVLFALPAVTP